MTLHRSSTERHDLPFASRLGGRPTAVAALFGVASVAAVIGWFAVVPGSASVNVDDGVYAVQAVALNGGGLSIPHLLAEVDPDGYTHPFVNTVSENGFYLLPHHAAWSMVLHGFRSVAGDLGMHAAPALGLAIAVMAAYFTTRAIGFRRTAPLAAGLALASPMLFDAMQLWAHTAVAGAIGVALLGCAWILRDGLTGGSAVLVLFGCAVAAILRGDGLIFALAIGIVLAVHAAAARRMAVAAFGLGILLVSAGAYVALRSLVANHVGVAATGAGGDLAQEASRRGTFAADDRLRGAVSTLFTNWRYGGFPSAALLAVAALLVVIAARSMRRGNSRDAGYVLIASATVLLVRIAIMPGASIAATGIIGGWPVVLLIFAVRIRDRNQSEQFLLGVIVVATLGVLATQSSVGGGLNWGGRYISAATPVIAVLVASGMERAALKDLREPGFAVLATVGVALVSVAGMLRLDSEVRQKNDSILAQLDAVDPDLPIVTSHRVLPLLDWGAYPDRRWLRVPAATRGGAELLASMLDEAGVDEVVVFHVAAEDVRLLRAGAVVHERDGETSESGRIVVEPLVVSIGPGS